MPLNREDREEITRLISEAKDSDSAFISAFIRFQSTWAALAIVGAIALTTGLFFTH